MARMIQFPETLGIGNRTKVQWAARMDSIRKENRSMHPDRTLDRTYRRQTKMTHARGVYHSSVSLPLPNEQYSTE